MDSEKGRSGSDFMEGTVELCPEVIVANFVSVDAKLNLEKKIGKTLDQIDFRSWNNLMPICIELAKQVNPEIDVKIITERIRKANSLKVETILLEIFKVDLKNLMGPVTEIQNR